MSISNKTKWVRTVCYMCQANDNTIRACVVDGKIVKVEGDPDGVHDGRICAKGLSSLLMPYNISRVTKPLRRKNPNKGIGVDPEWEEISWEEAIDTIAENLKRIRRDNPLKLMVNGFDYPP